MPNCFQLTLKGQKEPMKLAEVDNFICNKLNVEPDPVEWYLGWYDFIGLALATGYKLAEIKAEFADTDLVPVINLLEENFDVDAWCSR